MSISLKDIQRQAAALQSAERFFDSAVLFALFELGVLRELAGGPRDLDALHAVVGGDAETLRAVLDAAVALKLLARDGQEYAADEALVETLGREESAAYLGEWVEFLHALSRPLLDLAEAARTGRPPGADFEDMGEASRPARLMTRAMDAYARGRGAEIAARIDFSGARALLDLGCGPGTYALAILERYPEVRATLLDLPGPIAEARRIVEERGMSDRVELVTGDALQWSPGGRSFDAVLVSNTLHVLGPERSRALLARCRDLVAPGGRLIVQAQLLNDDRTSPRWATLLNLIQRVTTREGRNHSVSETCAWLRDAGFTDVEHVRFSVWNVNSAVVGRR